MFLKPLACLANLFDHRYHGRRLSPELRTNALSELERYCKLLRCDCPCEDNLCSMSLSLLRCECPCLDDISEFIEARGRFGRLPTLHCTPMSLWQTLFEGDPLAQLASMLTTLPCAQASSERVFSSANWGSGDRERLTFSKLSREVFIRWNILALSND